MPRKIAILKESVSREILDKVHIRASDEDIFEFEGTRIPVWFITLSGLKKLKEYGYTTGDIMPVNDDIEFCPLSNLDDSPASAAIDPATVRVVKFSSFNGENSIKSKLEELVKSILIPVVNKNIDIYVPHNAIKAVNTASGWFHINIWSSPVGGRYDVPHQMWGIDTPDTSNGNFGLWMGGEPVVTSEGFEIAAFDDNNLFIYFDVVHQDCDRAVALFKKIMEYVAANYNSKLGDAERRAFFKKTYINVSLNRFETERKSAEDFIEKASEKADKLKKDLLNIIRQAQSNSRRLKELSVITDDAKNRLGLEFDSLFKLAKVKNVSWRGTKLVVRTDTLYCRHPKTKKLHLIGDFDIVMDQETSSIYYYNRTHLIDGMHNKMNGPHLFPDGRPCLGNMSAVIPVLIANYEWGAAISQAIAFVESVNLEDAAGAKLGNWPVVDEEKLKREGVSTLIAPIDDERKEMMETVSEDEETPAAMAEEE